MERIVFVALFALALALFASSSITMLVRPSKFLDDQSEWRRNNIESRIWIRSVGLVFSLFTLLVGSALVARSRFARSFRDNLLIALWASFFLAPIANYFLWTLSASKFARQALIEGINEDPVYERKLSAVYIGLLLLTVGVAFLRSLR
jgi:hypothetical protein